MIEVIRKIIEDEISKLYVAELGVITSIFPHSGENDKENYECNVKLKYRDLELRKVPVATQHIGLANIPNVGDLVLVTFLNGNVNAPVIIGRLYTDEDRPPTNKEEEIIYIPPYSKSSDLRRIHMEFPGGIILSVKDDQVSVEAGKTTLKMNRDGDIDIESAAKVNMKATGDMSLSAANLKIESRGTLDVKATGTAKFEATGPLNIKGSMVNIN
jgi:phage baseplate assembly protein gpV